ncbi:MAG: hypothetical protein KUG75_00235 [Pseudomonadales bacterium]|nr:hypothetical protein [Pseudomonadales bacterium]
MLKNKAKNFQAIDIANNIVLAQLVVPELKPAQCVAMRRKIRDIFQHAAGKPILESQAARQFDALESDVQLLVIASILAGQERKDALGLAECEWVYFANPLQLETNSSNIHQARKLFFQWQIMHQPEISALKYLYENWVDSEHVVRGKWNRRSIVGKRQVVLGHS